MEIKKSTLWKRRRDKENCTWDSLELCEDMLKLATNRELDIRLLAINSKGSITWDSDDLEGKDINEDALLEILNKNQADSLAIINSTHNYTDSFRRMEESEATELLKETIRNMNMFDRKRQIDRDEYERANAE